MAAIAPVPKLQFFAANGTPLVGGKLYSYAAGTTAPLATYTDAGGGTANPNPVVLDSRGEASVWLGTSLYKLVLMTATDVEVWTVDNVAGSATLAQLAASGGSALVTFMPLGTGAASRTVQSKLRDVVSIKDFGAIGNGSADDTQALQNAANYAASSGSRLMGFPGTFKITSTLQLNCSGDLSEMTIVADAKTMDPAVRVGPTSGYLFDAELALPKVTNSAKTTTGWTGFSTASGVELANVYQSRITVKEIRGFGIGLTCGGYNAGCVYNTVDIGILANNKINLRLKPQLTTGWANQNLFIGGRYFHDSAEGTNISGCYHIQCIEADGSVTDTSPNNNLFLNPSVEGSETQYAIYLMGAYNQFVNARFEPSGKVLLIGTLSNMTRGNVIAGGYDSGGITYTVSGGTNVGVNQVMGLAAKNTMDFSGTGVNVRNSTGTGLGNPHFQGFSSGTNPINKDESATDWMYRIYGQGLAGKRSTDAYPIFQLLWDNSRGYILFGDGTATPGVVWTSGVGSPEGAITGNVGSLYTRTDGGASTTLYVKTSGTGNTGWTAK